MEPFKPLTARSRSGTEEPVHVRILETHPHVLKCTRASGATREYEAGNFFRCLALLREDLEKEDLLLCCQGARLDVTVSGMQIQMSNGLYAYEFDPVKRIMSRTEVHILAPAHFAEVGTVEEQRQAVYALHGLHDSGSEESP